MGPKRLAQGESKRGVDMVLIELKGKRQWVVDHFDEAQRMAEVERWRRAEDAAWTITPERFQRAIAGVKAERLIADLEKLYTT